MLKFGRSALILLPGFISGIRSLISFLYSANMISMVYSPDAREIWNKCLKGIRSDVSAQAFKTWFEPITAVNLVGNELIIQVPSKFHYEWLESNFLNTIRKSITHTLGASAVLKYQIAQEDSGPDPLPDPVRTSVQQEPTGKRPSSADKPVRPEAPAVGDSIDSNLNPRHTFDSFIKGDSNQLARAAAFAVSDNPGGNSFNPLFIYGGVGLGKTHLLQAIGNRVKHHKPNKKVVYLSSERFTIDFVNAIQNNRVSEFTTFYRGVDLLLMDDVQFFSGKEKTQEEFFHIFNTLHQSGRQIVLTSDRPPKDMKFFEERLLSRFQWGLAADIQPPDLETRIAILHHKSREQDFTLEPEIIEYIALNVTNNVRQLEGCLVKLIAQSSLTHATITLAMARDTLRDIIKPSKINLSIEAIQRIVSEYFGIPDDLLRDSTRKQEIVRARQIAMYLAKEFTQSSLKTIGLHFGRRDHTTVIHACESVQNQAETNDKYRRTLDDIRRKIEMSL